MRIILFLLSLSLLSSCSNHWRTPASTSDSMERYMPGDIKISLLTPDRFRELHGPVWVLMDGGIDLADQKIFEEFQELSFAELGIDKIPDARGKFLRMSNNGIACDDKDKCDYDPQEREIGSFQNDAVRKHLHKFQQMHRVANGRGAKTHIGTSRPVHRSADTEKTGDFETRPKNISVNFYIKVTSCPSDNSILCY